MNLRQTLLCTTSALLTLTACQGPAKQSSAAVQPYPLEDCLVTDNQLGSMGDPVTIVYEGQEIKFCCDPCEEEFLAEPEKFLSKLKR